MRRVISDQRVRNAPRTALNAGMPRFRGRCVLAFAVLVVSTVVSGSSARADDVTYNIVDYPVNELLVSATGSRTGTATIGGTIITDGTSGTLSAANIVGGTFSFMDPVDDLTVAGSASFSVMAGLQATSRELVLTAGTNSLFTVGTPATFGGLYQASVMYDNDPSQSEYRGVLAYDSMNPPIAVLIASFDSMPVPTTPGSSIGANADWIIATVPEPSRTRHSRRGGHRFRRTCAAVAAPLLPRVLPVEIREQDDGPTCFPGVNEPRINRLRQRRSHQSSTPHEGREMSPRSRYSGFFGNLGGFFNKSPCHTGLPYRMRQAQVRRHGNTSGKIGPRRSGRVCRAVRRLRCAGWPLPVGLLAIAGGCRRRVARDVSCAWLAPDISWWMWTTLTPT